MKKIKQNIRNIDSCRGFTLLEIMIAMFILTFAMLALVSVTVTVIKGNASNKINTTATTLAKDQLEKLKNDSLNKFDEIPATTSWEDVAGFPGYKRRYDAPEEGSNFCTAAKAPSACCTGAGTGTCPKKKNVTMQVRYLWQGSYKTVTLNTIITSK